MKKYLQRIVGREIIIGLLLSPGCGVSSPDPKIVGETTFTAAEKERAAALMSNFSLEEICFHTFTERLTERGWMVYRPDRDTKIVGPLSLYDITLLSMSYFQEAAEAERYCY